MRDVRAASEAGACGEDVVGGYSAGDGCGRCVYTLYGVHCSRALHTTGSAAPLLQRLSTTGGLCVTKHASRVRPNCVAVSIRVRLTQNLVLYVI